MTETVHLEPHDPMPDGPGRQVVVIRRAASSAPQNSKPFSAGVCRKSRHTGQPAGTAELRCQKPQFVQT